MLESFEIRNFRSILDLKLDFRYGESAAPRHYQESETWPFSEVGIVDKTLERGTSFSRISDFDGVRNVTNSRKQYLSGAYSGIPFPYI